MENMGYDFEAVSPLFDEEGFKQQQALSPKELCQLLGQKKSESLIQQFKNDIIIGSDQMLVFKNRTYNKPKTLEQAIERLQQMNNDSHQLLTSLYVYSPHKCFNHLDITTLTLKNLSPDQIHEYVHLDKPIGCAGGYKYELNGKNLFAKVESQDPSSIVGLPIKTLQSIIEEIKHHE